MFFQSLNASTLLEAGIDWTTSSRVPSRVLNTPPAVRGEAIYCGVLKVMIKFANDGSFYKPSLI